VTTRDKIIQKIKEFLKDDRELFIDKKKHLPLERFKSFSSELSGDIKEVEVHEHILKHSKKGKCNKVFYADPEEFIDKTGCGSYGDGMPCICNEPEEHEGNCVCGECGEEW